MLQLQGEGTSRKYVKPRTAASKPMDTQPDESAGKMSKIASEMNLLQPFVGSKPYMISVTYIASNKEGNIQPFLCVVIIDTESPISLKPEYALINCRYYER